MSHGISLLLPLAFVLIPLALPADPVAKAVKSAAAVGTLTTNDVPAKWRVTKKVVLEKSTTSSTFSRGSRPVLVIGEKSGSEFFRGHFLDGTNVVADLVGTPDSVVVEPQAPPDQYRVFVSVSHTTNSTVLVDGTNGFYEMYILDDRRTAPISDLDYTKTKVFEESVWKPLAEAVTNPPAAPKVQ